MLAVLHFIAPLGNVVANAFFSRQELSAYLAMSLTSKYLMVNWPIVVAPIVAGIAIYACKKWSFYVYLLAISGLFLFNYQGYLSKSDLVGLGPAVFFYAINILVVAYFLIPAVQEIYFNPRLRWWETKPRFKYDTECDFYADNQTYHGTIGNFSEGGLFLKTKNAPADDVIINIEFHHGQNKMKFTGKTVHHARQNRDGFGVQFIHGPQTFQAAKMICKDLEARGQRISSPPSRVEDSFFYWAKNLVTTGKGIIPRKDT